jgi:hypothetical protein
MQSLGKDLWTVAPLEDAPAPAIASIPGGEAPPRAEEDAGVLGFPDHMHENHGSRSVIFVRPVLRPLLHG